MRRTACRIDRANELEQLEFLAAISTKWELELEKRRRVAADAARHDGVQEFVEAITRSDFFSSRIAPNREEIQEFVNAITGSSEIFILEGNWSPSKHPRAPKGQTDGGQLVVAGSSLGRGANSAATSSDSRRATASLAAWHPPVGHHWVPVGVTQHPGIRQFLSDDAVAYAAGAYSGPTDPHHRNTTAGGVKHPEYNGKVRAEIKEFIKKNNISRSNKMTGAQMKEFAELMENGLDANGEAHPFIGRYNKAIKGMVPSSRKVNKIDEVLAAGRKYMKNSRFRVLAAGAVVSGILDEVVAAQVKVLEVAATSGHYERALRELENGNLDKAQRFLVGDGQSLYTEILGQVGAQAALNFKQAMEEVFVDASQRDYK